MGGKEEFIAQMKVRTKKFGVDVINFVETLKPCKAASPIIYREYKVFCVNYSIVKKEGGSPILVERNVMSS